MCLLCICVMLFGLTMKNPCVYRGFLSGTVGGNRTHTPLRALDFESSASANSATTAQALTSIRLTHLAKLGKLSGRTPLDAHDEHQDQNQVVATDSLPDI